MKRISLHPLRSVLGFLPHLLGLLPCVLAGCGYPATAQIQVEEAFPMLSFSRPVDLTHAGDGRNNLYVVEQAGIIRVFPNVETASGSEVFLDIRSRVNSSGNEEGLLGLAFHPDFKSNGYFFVNYTANPPRRTVISRFRIQGGDPEEGDPNSEEIILTFSQPYSNHNGGQIRFGPDGFLYIATGDGGSGGDPQRNGQSTRTLLGKILRIDVDNPSGGKMYGIPAGNPFRGSTEGHAEEIYAWGLRNPWRFSFDPETGRLWTGDVGQNKWEEVDIIEAGKNYGWNIMEGLHCYSPSSGCDTTGLVLPVVEYGHDLGISITGGFVYRGNRVPELVGKYLYADFGSGRIWSVAFDDQNRVVSELVLPSGLNISSFGIDASRELYMCTFNEGKIFRFTTAKTGSANPPTREDAIIIDPVFPNPASRFSTASVRVAVQSGWNKPARIVVSDSAGRERVDVWQGTLDPGHRVFDIPLRGLTPGAYFCLVEIGEQRITRSFSVHP